MPRSIPPAPKTERQLLAAGLALLALVVLGALAALSYSTANHWLRHTLQVRQQTDDWFIALLDAETGMRGYVMSADRGFLAPYEAALLRERKQAANVKRLVGNDPVQAQNVAVADRNAQRVMAELQVAVSLVASGQQARALTAVSAGHGKSAMDTFRKDVRRIRQKEEQLLQARRADAQWLGWLTLLGGLLLVVAAAALLALAWRRERTHDRILQKLAHDARLRLANLFSLAATLAQARTRAQVADAIVDQGMRAAGADTCTLYALDEHGTALELLGHRGVAAAVIDQIRRISESSGNPGVFARMKAGESTWAENDADYLEIFPALANLKVEGPRARAFWSMPLRVEGRIVGLVGAGFYTPRTFTIDERAFVQAFADLCAQALLRATRLERENEAQRWFTTTLRSIGDAVIATDASGRITFMNPVAEALTNWTEGEARNRPLDEVFCIFSEQTGAVAESPVAKVLREGKVVGLANHTVLRSRHGFEIAIDDSGAPIRGDDGTLVGVVLVFRDVTPEKRDRVRREFQAKAGAALASSLDYQATLATVARLAVPTLADWCAIELGEQAHDARQVAVAHVDPTKVQFAQEFAERYPPDRDAPTGAPNVIRTGVSELYTTISDQMLEAGARDAEHLRLMRELRLDSAMVVPLRTRGKTLGAMTFIYAESGRRYTKDDLEFAEDFARHAALAIENALVLKEAETARSTEHRLRSEAEVANRAKDEFLATVSHELRTPLNAILGWVVMLRERESGADVERGLAVIERNARAQTKLIEDVLDISRIISGKLSLSLSTTNVADAVRSAIETVTPAAATKNITISSELPDQRLSISADPDRLQQIVWNLLSNAVKFTPVAGSITVRVVQEATQICICVSDTGEGIRPEALAHIFEPFQQADSSITRRHGGLGLGLAIVKQLVSAHGGTVDATSAGQGKGASFSVRFPASHPELTAGHAVVMPAVVDGVVHTPKLRGTPLNGLRLLVIDDEPDALAMLAAVLGNYGADVNAVASAFDALEKFSSLRPDVIVSDIGMPSMDGYSLIRKIRALPPELGGRTPAIALTAYAGGQDAQRAFAAGYQLHVAKPIEPSKLAVLIANLGGRSLDDV